MKPAIATLLVATAPLMATALLAAACAGPVDAGGSLGAEGGAAGWSAADAADGAAESGGATGTGGAAGSMTGGVGAGGNAGGIADSSADMPVLDGPPGSSGYPSEVEVNDTIATANPLAPGTQGFTGWLPSATDIDVFAFVVTVAGSSVRLETGDGGADGGVWGCPYNPATGTSMKLLDAAGTELAKDTNSGPGQCSLIDPNAVAGARDLAIGTYYVSVTPAPAIAILDYVLGITVIPPSCGDGAVQAATGETCDDGNTAPDDGCGATCRLEPGHETDLCNGTAITLEGAGTGQRTGSASGSTSSLHANYAGTCGLSDAAPDAVYNIVSDVDGDGLATIAAADFDAVVYVRSDCTLKSDEIACDDVGGRSGDTVRFSVKAAVPYFIMVDGATGASGHYLLDVRVVPHGCGNGVLEGGETCDDGNTQDGDGCASGCAWETGHDPDICPGIAIPLLGTGPERTGTFGASTAAMSSNYVGTCGASGSARDAVFSFTPDFDGGVTIVVDHPATFDAIVYARRTCDLTGSEIACGDAVATASDKITFGVRAELTYFVVVDGYGGDSGPFGLSITLRQPTCGNGMVEVPEECDDGNLVAKDGCSDQCMNEDSDVCPGVSLALVPTGGTPAWGGSATGDTTPMTDDLTDGACGGLGPDVVYAITPEIAGTVTATLSAASFASILAVRSTCGAAPTQLKCDGGASGAHTGHGGQTVSFPALAGVTYFLVVDGYSGEAGTFSLDVSMD